MQASLSMFIHTEQPISMVQSITMKKRQKRIFKIVFVTISTVALIGVTVLPALVGLQGGFGY